ncbi:uncharacterized protein conserved in bacteria [Microbacterium testaceum StLB037]|uniref:Uncharacterized protein conserved in bacteria n=1 Tax=Microbacterium testaceum (strain StLB037) TaxID=979556 RepID=E8N7P2_MICTS|nr:hypothetical protein [Microbacterium testaceum]BAJ74298.1 uncharacterized protein conserved in bacteria [Microbacterium testaceum StLB037]
MLDCARIDLRLLDDVAAAVHDLVTTTGIDPRKILLVGARCRDAIHSALGRTTPTRLTTDLDLGIAIASWNEFERIGSAFASIQSNGIAFRVAGMHVDVVPFGDVAEEPRGLSRPSTRNDDIVVFGFQEVFDRASILTLPTGEPVRLPQPSGYGLLKTRAWADRSAHGDHRDAQDLAVALDWYAQDPSTIDRLFSADIDISELYGFDAGQSSAHLLGRDIRRHLIPSDANDLVSRFTGLDARPLAGHLLNLPQDRSRRFDIVEAFTRGLRDAQLPA